MANCPCDAAVPRKLSFPVFAVMRMLLGIVGFCYPEQSGCRY